MATFIDECEDEVLKCEASLLPYTVLCHMKPFVERTSWTLKIYFIKFAYTVCDILY